MIEGRHETANLLYSLYPTAAEMREFACTRECERIFSLRGPEARKEFGPLLNMAAGQPRPPCHTEEFTVYSQQSDIRFNMRNLACNVAIFHLGLDEEGFLEAFQNHVKEHRRYNIFNILIEAKLFKEDLAELAFAEIKRTFEESKTHGNSVTLEEGALYLLGYIQSSKCIAKYAPELLQMMTYLPAEKEVEGLDAAMLRVSFADALSSDPSAIYPHLRSAILGEGQNVSGRIRRTAFELLGDLHSLPVESDVRLMKEIYLRFIDSTGFKQVRALQTLALFGKAARPLVKSIIIECRKSSDLIAACLPVLGAIGGTTASKFIFGFYDKAMDGRLLEKPGATGAQLRQIIIPLFEAAVALLPEAGAYELLTDALKRGSYSQDYVAEACMKCRQFHLVKPLIKMYLHRATISDYFVHRINYNWGTEGEQLLNQFAKELSNRMTNFPAKAEQIEKRLNKLKQAFIAARQGSESLGRLE